MRMLVDRVPGPELTYDDVFLIPRPSRVGSRATVDLSSGDATGTTIPIVVSNMTAVAGRRMAETVARRGGLAIIPQDIPADVVAGVIGWVKSRHVVYDTAIELAPTDTVSEALALLPKRAHGALVVVDDGRPVGLVTEADCTNVDRFTQLRAVMSTDLLTVPSDVSPPSSGWWPATTGSHRSSRTGVGWWASSPARELSELPSTARRLTTRAGCASVAP